MDVDTDITVEDLKCLLEIESQIPVNEQALFFKNKELNEDAKKLTACGVSNNDMLMLTKTSGLIGGGRSNVNQSDQDLLNNFFTQLNQDIARPKMNFKQMFNSLFHNEQNRVIKMQVEQIKQIWN